ncbi:MAG: hypothetical protein QG562_128 [Patescibacteria group bacterium]|nr:hypothetical protein [Patescibacteria group bacterium]MDQ5958310.1 hypothetical protein [Patescibacteria group bacterium]
MANIADFSDALTQEALLVKKYEKLAQEAVTPENRQALEELVKLSEQKMKLIYNLMASINWFSE